MRTNIEERACELAEYIIQNKATVRAAAERFGVSKSTVHKDMTERLKEIDRLLYEKVRLVLEQNKAERHLRGGAATKARYAGATKRANSSISRKSRSCTGPSGEPRP